MAYKYQSFTDNSIFVCKSQIKKDSGCYGGVKSGLFLH